MKPRHKKIIKYYLKEFILNYIKENPNFCVKSANLYRYFCILYDISPKLLSAQSFYPLFKNMYEEINGKSIVTKMVRYEKSLIPARCVLDISMNLVPQQTMENLLNHTLKK